jgi:AbrB family looped-hinge helix DNA binding protein
MAPKTSRVSETAIEAVVTSKGQVTLPKALRRRLGIDSGSRIRFTLHPGGFHGERVLYDLDDLWKMADSGGKTKRFMSFEEMDKAKARRKA